MSRAAGDLADRLSIFHPDYRLTMLGLGLFGAGLAALSYGENAAMAALAGAFVPESPNDSELPGAAIAWPLLVAFAGLRLLRSVTQYGVSTIEGYLRIRAWSDTERDLLANLLRREEGVLGGHVPAEVVTRLAQDLPRTAERRLQVMQIWGVAATVIANVAFFFSHSVWLGLIASGVAVMGGLALNRLLRPIWKEDGEFLARNDRVKAIFADYLAAAPEIQVGDLAPGVLARFGAEQTGRDRNYRAFARANALFAAADGFAGLVALLVLIAALLWLQTGAAPGAIALLPVVILALPKLLHGASRAMTLRLQFRLANTSVERLLEYAVAPEAREQPATAEFVDGSSIAVDDVHFGYRNSVGEPQGGVRGVSVTLPPRGWVALAGHSGSGKSTLLQLVLGLLEPDSGTVRYGDRETAAMSRKQSGEVFSLMPQDPVILNGSIRENLVFGRIGWPGADRLSPDDHAIVEQAGLAHVARLRALGRRPDAAAGRASIHANCSAMRWVLRERIEDFGVPLLAYEVGGADLSHWLLECALDGCADREAVLETLAAPDAAPVLHALAQTPLGGHLAAAADHVLAESWSLLHLGDYGDYLRLASEPIPERVWAWRRAHGRSQDLDNLMRIGLTATPRTLEPESSEWWLRVTVDELQGADLVQSLFGEHCPPFDPDALHPFLPWRENLVFASLDYRNDRQRRQVELAMLNVVSEFGHTQAFTEIGLDSPVGRGGRLLSGGERQMLALCRTLLRRTPVTILDEPSSALDPRSRDRIVELLRQVSRRGLVMTITHDPEVHRYADSILVLEDGQLVTQTGAPRPVESARS